MRWDRSEEILRKHTRWLMATTVGVWTANLTLAVWLVLWATR